MHSELKVQWFERDSVMERLQRSEPGDVANFTSWIVPVRESQSLLDRARQQLDPLLPASNPAISFYPSLAAKELVVRFRALACLRWHESVIYFGGRDIKTKWDPGKSREREELFRELENFRHPLASETRHPLFRAQSERWLEFLVRQEVTGIASSLHQRFALAQVLATTAGEHGILDVFTRHTRRKIGHPRIKNKRTSGFPAVRKILAAHPAAFAAAGFFSLRIFHRRYSAAGPPGFTSLRRLCASIPPRKSCCTMCIR